MDGVYGTRDAACGHRLPEALGHDARRRSSGPVTWRELIWHYELPVVQRGQDPVRLQRRQRRRPTGRPARRSASSRRPPRRSRPRATGGVSVGDASFEHGGNIPGHQTHERGPRHRHPADPRRREPVHVGHQLAVRLVRPDGDPGAHQGHPGGRPGPRQAHLLQRPGPHPRGPHDVVRRPRRPPPHPLLRARPTRSRCTAADERSPAIARREGLRRPRCHNGDAWPPTPTPASSRRPTGRRRAGGSATARRSRGSTRRRPRRATSSRIKERYGLFIGGRDVPAEGGGTFATVNPATEETLAQVAKAHAGRCRQGGPRRAPRPDPLVGHAAGQGTRQVPVPDRADPPGAQPRVRRPRIDGLRQADQGEPRRRRPARGGPFLVLRRLGGQARVRVPGARRAAARRRRPDHPVELPAADARLEDRAGPGRRQHGRAQARLHDAAVRPPLRRRLPPGRPAARRRQHRHRARARSGWPW